jgi:hypothetical protein
VGTWEVAKDLSCDANGTADGTGYLEAIVLSNGRLGEPFKVGKLSPLTATADGILFVRCHDSWAALSDNEGELQVYVRRSVEAK